MPEPGGSSGPHGLELTRVFAAPRERLWREWTEPERFADWFGGREADVPVAGVSMDVRPGGRWQATVHRDGAQTRWEGEYREVVEPARLVLTFSDAPGEEAHELVTVVFTDLGDGRTEMRLQQRGTHSRDLYERTLSGWASFLDRMAERLGHVRVATLNAFGRREDWPARRAVMVAGFADLRADLVALQEVIADAEYDQVRDVLGAGYELAHHSERERDGQGISIASRWPITAVHEVDLHLGPRPAGFACSALVAEIHAPQPVGRLVFVNHLPDWQLGHEAERERQTVAVADFLEHLVGDERVHVIVAGDMDAPPDAATMRFWTGRQSLQGRSVIYRDAWAAGHPDETGHTFTPENTLTTTAEVGDWELELGRRIDYVLVRCSDHGPTLDVTACRRLFDAPVDGVWASDHFGVTADLSAFTPTGRHVP